MLHVGRGTLGVGHGKGKPSWNIQAPVEALSGFNGKYQGGKGLNIIIYSGNEHAGPHRYFSLLRQQTAFLLEHLVTERVFVGLPSQLAMSCDKQFPFGSSIAQKERVPETLQRMPLPL